MNMYKTVEELLKDISYPNITNTVINLVNIEVPKHASKKIENTIKHIYNLIQNNILLSYEEFKSEIFIMPSPKRMYIPLLNTKHVINSSIIEGVPEIQDFIHRCKNNHPVLLYTVSEKSDVLDTICSAINTFFNNNMKYIADIAAACIVNEILRGEVSNIFLDTLSKIRLAPTDVYKSIVRAYSSDHYVEIYNPLHDDAGTDSFITWIDPYTLANNKLFQLHQRIIQVEVEEDVE